MLGARPLRRTIQRAIEDVLSEKILYGELKAGELVLVNAEGEGKSATFTFVGTPDPGSIELPVVETVGDSADAGCPSRYAAWAPRGIPLETARNLNGSGPFRVPGRLGGGRRATSALGAPGAG